MIRRRPSVRELDELLEELAGAAAATRAKRFTEVGAEYQDAVAELARLRLEAVRELVAEGKTHQEIAEILGVTRARVGKLLSSGPKPERALLGTGALVIAVGGKDEGPRSNPSTMYSRESLAARDLITVTARDYGLDTSHDMIDSRGNVNLNRPNLIVIGSPRLLPFVTQVLEADQNLGFGTDARGWYLTEGDKLHRSPADRGESTDFAYLGRLPRPDSKGTFLYVAGVHALGTLGAARHLCNHVTELYQQVRTRRWSILVECRYDPDTRVVLSTEPITPLYK